VHLYVFVAAALFFDAAPLYHVARDVVYATRGGVPVSRET